MPRRTWRDAADLGVGVGAVTVGEVANEAGSSSMLPHSARSRLRSGSLRGGLAGSV